MITNDKIALYIKYGGYIDLWDRTGTEYEKTMITYQEWNYINEYARNIRLASQGIISNIALEQIENNVQHHCESLDLFLKVKKIAQKKSIDDPKKNLLYRFLIWVFNLK
jgi:hypothetical protein